VFNDGFSGTIKVNGVNQIISGGLLTMTIPADPYEITKDVTANLYYMSVQYSSLGLKDVETQKLKLYPNPVSNDLHLSSHESIEKVQVYNMLGVLVKSVEDSFESINMSDVSNGSYLVKVFTDQSVVDRIIIKR
jgi:pectate lyase